jgi:hypothetical protein
MEPGEKLGHENRVAFEVCQQFMRSPLPETPMSLCKSCRGFIDLQLCLLDLDALQFKKNEKLAIK